MISPALRLDIELAWLTKGRAIDIARRFRGLRWRQVARVWRDAKAAGRLPNIKRPAGGFELAQLVAIDHRALRITLPIKPEARAA